ncbi:MAG: tail fiber domain-containing protein [Candidatus Paceibacterota bacterium]|jgi:hypothetical protein
MSIHGRIFHSRKPLIFIVLALTLLVVGSFVVYAAGRVAPYNPGDTLNPDCAPGEENCTVADPFSEHLIINSHGQVGIGTSTFPGSIHGGSLTERLRIISPFSYNKVDIHPTCIPYGDCGGSFLSMSPTSAASGISYFSRSGTSSDYLILNANSNGWQFALYETGDVVIGTSIPQGLLTVAGDIVSTSTIHAQGVGTSTFVGNILMGTSTEFSPGGKFRVVIDDNDPEAQDSLGTTQGVKSMILKTQGRNIAVNGTAHGLGAFQNVGLYGWADQGLQNWGLEVAAGYSIMKDRVSIGTTTTESMLTISATSSVSKIFDVYDSDGINTLSILNNGNVGIGTSTPDTKFSVVGTISAENFIGTSNATSTLNGGLNILSGCFSVNGVCIGSGSSDSFSTTSADNWFSIQSTTNLAEGTNQYFTTARAREALSSTAPGLSYATSTGVLSLTSGYSIPLTASTTEWSNKISSQWTTNGSSIYYNDGSVGIGVTNPVAPLHVSPSRTIYSAITFESGDLEGGVAGGDVSWVVDGSSVGGNGGTLSAHSEDLSDSQISTLSFTMSVPSDATHISFDKRVSSEEGYDYLIFYIDDVEQVRFSGEVAWSNSAYAITEGNHDIKFEYSKDSSESAGLDTVWVDNVSVIGSTGSYAAIFDGGLQVTSNIDVGANVVLVGDLLFNGGLGLRQVNEGLSFGKLNTLSSATTSFALGAWNTVNGLESLASGFNNNLRGDHSFAYGHGNEITNSSYSTVLGLNNDAFGDYSFALGYNNTASSTNSASAVGVSNNAFGQNSSAFGWNNNAIEVNSSAFGYSNTASGMWAAAFGYANNANADDSVAFGHGNTASAANSSAFGYGNTASGTYSGAFGYFNDVSGENALAFGLNLTNSIDNSLVLGPSNSAKLTILPSGEVQLPYITSTDTATSTFAGGINLTSGCFSVNGVCIGSGSSDSFSTTSADNWFSIQSTTNLAEGANQYFTTARAREALSSTAPGLSYATSTGVLSLTSGYNIPSTASTTDWNTAYLNRISSATSPLSLSSGVLAISQANASSGGYVSASDWVRFNSLTNSWQLSTNGIYYNAGGKVGIGTSNPISKFSVVQDSNTAAGGMTISSLPSGQGSNWTANSTGGGTRDWVDITSSADGMKLAALDGSTGKYIYTSTDGGQSWTQRFSLTASGYYWYSIASSADGTKLVAISAYSGMGGGKVFTSTDSGVTWTQRTGLDTTDPQDVASSADGNKLAIATVGSDDAFDYIYTSVDSGATWTQQTAAGNRTWRSIASSADGAKLVAVTYGSYIFTSTDSGVTWTQRTVAGSRYWTSVTSSSDGTKLAAVYSGGSNGYIYTSSDSGSTWTQQTAGGARRWSSISSSEDGSIIIAGAGSPGYLYTSTDSGVSWNEQTGAGSRYWADVVSSSDGTKIAALSDDSNASIYTYSTTYTSTSRALFVDDSDYFHISSSGGDALFTSSGGLALGTTTSAKLSVAGNTYLGGNVTATGTLTVSSTATSTFAGDINLTSGCYAVNGVCIDIGFSTTSTDSWLTTKTTDNLTEGVTNKYYADSLARAAVSSSATGLTYTGATGIFSLTSGYGIPLTASTTEWAGKLSTTTAASIYLPYTGAIGAVNLGSQNITSTGISTFGTGRFTAGIKDNAGTPIISIDPGSRKLFASNGVSVGLNYSLADALSGAGAGNPVNYSNFFGNSAGTSATSASNSNFFGVSAGYSASNASYSNFFGSAAGWGAVNSSNSNFFGQYAGDEATAAPYSNFFGYYAGDLATSASSSNFFGYQAGTEASSASHSNFFGTNAGYRATMARESIFLGSYSGYNDAVNNTVNNGTSIAIGKYSGTGGFSNSIAIGHGVINSAATQLNIGNVLYATGIYNSNTQSSAPLSGGNVGIGTTTPGSKLDVYGGGLNITSDSTNGWLTLNTTSGNPVIYAPGGGFFMKSVNTYPAFYADNKVAFSNVSASTGFGDLNIIQSTGFVGVGSTTPSSKLTVTGNGYFGGNITATGTLSILGTGTSTFAGGINLTSGCFAISGVCVGNVSGSQTPWTSNIWGAGYSLSSVGNITLASSSDRVITVAAPTGAAGRNLTISSGSADMASSFSGGNLILTSGSGSFPEASGNVSIYSAVSSSGGSSGNVNIYTSSSVSMDSGDINLYTGSGNAGFAGDIFLTTGQGMFDLSYGNIILAKDGGNVGIGITNPTYKLNVSDTSTTNVARFAGSSSTQCTVVSGTGWSCTSDSRFKKNVNTLTNSLEKITKLEGVSFNWIDGDIDSKQIGFIAQDVEKIIPELVLTDDNGYKSLLYAQLTQYLAESVKELDIKISDIEKLIASTTNASPSSDGILGFVTEALEKIGILFKDGAAQIASVVTKTFKTGSIEIAPDDKRESGIVVYDRATGEKICMFVENGNMESEPGDCSLQVTEEENDNHSTPDDNVENGDTVSTTTLPVSDDLLDSGTATTSDLVADNITDGMEVNSPTPTPSTESETGEVSKAEVGEFTERLDPATEPEITENTEAPASEPSSSTGLTGSVVQ